MDLTYVEYATGERELYDLRTDPSQLSNLVKSTKPTALAALSKHLAKLATCAGEECRRLEDVPVGTELRLLSEASPTSPVVPATVKK